jgi:hypothetical protein
LSVSDLPYVSAHEWVDVVSRMRLGTIDVRPPSKPGSRPVTITGKMVKAVANRLAWYADIVDGTRVYPGPARLAVVCEVDYKTVKHAYAVLRGLGLIALVAPARGPQGSRSRNSDEYRLTLPEDLLDRVTVLTPSEMDREIERVRDAGRGTRTRTVGGNGNPPDSTDPQPVHTPEPPVDNPESGGTRHPPTEQDARKVGGNGTPADSELGGTGRPSWGEPEPRIPTKDLPTKTTDHDPVPAQPPTARAPAAPDPPPDPPPGSIPAARLAGAAS